MERLPIDCSAAENAEGGKQMIIKLQDARGGGWRREKKKYNQNDKCGNISSMK